LKPEYVEETKGFASDVIVIPHFLLEWIRKKIDELATESM
jgi:hypothetical protein